MFAIDFKHTFFEKKHEIWFKYFSYDCKKKFKRYLKFNYFIRPYQYFLLSKYTFNGLEMVIL
jgi:hypothetical protein